MRYLGRSAGRVNCRLIERGGRQKQSFVSLFGATLGGRVQRTREKAEEAGETDGE